MYVFLPALTPILVLITCTQRNTTPYVVVCGVELFSDTFTVPGTTRTGSMPGTSTSSTALLCMFASSGRRRDIGIHDVVMRTQRHASAFFDTSGCRVLISCNCDLASLPPRSNCSDKSPQSRATFKSSKQ